MQTKFKQFLLYICFCLISFSLFSTSAFFSDGQSFFKTQSQIVEQIVKFHPETVFIGGDITNYGSRVDDFEEFNRIMEPLTEFAEVYPALGNHDNDRDLFLKYFPQVDSLTYYFVEQDSVIWIILNSNLKLAPGSTQYNWLVDKLETYKNRTKVIIMHHPVFSSGPHGDEKGFNLLFPALFKRYSVSAVLSGHDHIYERSEQDSIFYIVFGGGGYPLYNRESRNDNSEVFKKTHGFLILKPVDGFMQAKAYDINGELIDEFSFIIKSTGETKEQ